MNEDRLTRLLERTGDTGRAGAELRARQVMREAFAERPIRTTRARRPIAMVSALVVALAVGLLAATSPGAAIADWVRDHVVGKPGVGHSAPALTHLPGGGRIVLQAREGVWVVNADGSRRLLPGYTGATWSPRGLYLGAWRGRELFALEPGGRVHWSLARSRPIRAADWSPDGFRIAYLSGDQLRVVAGDGTGDRELRRKVAAVAPVWRPRAPHMLALAAQPRVVDLVASDANALVWRRRVPERVRSLAWSADGRWLAVVGRTRVTVLDAAGGGVRRVLRTQRGWALSSVAFAHRAPTLAIVERSARGRSRATLVSLSARRPAQQLFAGVGRFERPQWSPDDRWVLLAWPAADQWLFVRAARVSSIRAVGAIAGQFSSSAARAQFPRAGGWCCGPDGG